MSRPAELFPFVIGGAHILPVLHESLEFAECVRRAVDSLRPDVVAVEIPSSLEPVWARAIDRLPAISVLLYETAKGQTVYLPVHPGDPMVEATRLARERELSFACIDLDIDGYADYRDPVPDAYSLLRLGLPRVYTSFRKMKRKRDPHDDRREAAMAYHAQRLTAEGAERLLLVCGMHHAEGIARELRREQAIPLTPPRRENLRLVNLHPESVGEVLPEIPFHVAAYEARRNGIPPAPPAPHPQTEAVKQYGPFRVLSGGLRNDGSRASDAIVRAARTGGEPALDRLKLQWSLLREAEHALALEAPDERVEPWQRLNLARFSRNLALAAGQLVPGLYDLLAAGRGCVSENYAWELHRLATAYPEQDENATDLPTARIRAEEMYEGTRRIRIRRRIRRPKRPDWRSLLNRRRMKERWPGEWLEGFDSQAICSYPPEDVVVEEFGRYLRRRGRSILSEEMARSVPFTTSILDGIDVRETIRHWSEKQIYVRELGREPGGVGSVVVIFDEDEERYEHCQTWIGEHEQESDMAFFCSDPNQGIAGPGICRVTYGGFLLSYPPRRMADVWSDADYAMAESKAETLLLAALDYCTEKLIVHVAARPPRSIMYRLAERFGLKILHIPIGTLSPTTLKRIRVMHILSGHDKRRIARDYIW
jgi:hypothetical protein